MAPQLTPQEALIYAMVTTAAVDRRITEDELASISSIVRELPVFRDFNVDSSISSGRHCPRICARRPLRSQPRSRRATFQ
jgi:hypothetical protein